MGRSSGPLRLTPFFDFPKMFPLHPVFFTVEVPSNNVHCEITIYKYVTAGGEPPSTTEQQLNAHPIRAIELPCLFSSDM